MGEINFSGRAYAKIILHATKYPHCAINGVLLGTASKGKVGSDLDIVDAVPLFHMSLHLTPMSEVALTMIEQYAIKQGLEIAGYYLANENINDISTDKPAHKAMSEKISDHFNHAILVVVDNKEMTMAMNTHPLRITQNSDGQWRSREKSGITYEGGAGLLEAMYYVMRNEEYRNLVDFDNHLDNISLDWRNLKLNKAIEEAMKSHR